MKPEELSCERELGLSHAQTSNVLKVNDRTTVSATRDSWGPGHYMITLATEEAGKGKLGKRISLLGIGQLYGHSCYGRGLQS